ncbi:EF-Tu/IF-2/RF-3 family GTPase [Ruminococcus flavefaciens]|uniref:EF-Tu/IF-2/RF-3 family GTPase n=1 Tax=Ruminococcus flavefaciens TaxID=1265 RepID=UPI0026EA20A0|nr:EF-Tu/IF-2/RF-3 family GTPase [Ruminococcus flavefaciens]
MGIFDNLKDKLLNREPKNHEFLTDDERELREYEEYYTPQSGVADGTYAEFVVSDVFSVSGRGTVAVGTVTGGVFSVGDKVVIVRGREDEIASEIIGIEQFRKVCTSVSEGANAGFLLKNVDRKQISRNNIIKKQ